MKHIQMFKQEGKEIVPVESEEEGEYLSRVCGPSNVIYDVGGNLTKLQDSLVKGLSGYDKDEIDESFEKKSELKWGITLRLGRLCPH